MYFYNFRIHYFVIAACVLHIIAIPQLAHAGERDVKSVVSVDSWQFKDNPVVSISRYIDVLEHYIACLPTILCGIIANYAVKYPQFTDSIYNCNLHRMYGCEGDNIIGGVYRSLKFFSLQTGQLHKQINNIEYTGPGVYLHSKRMLVLVHSDCQINVINYNDNLEQLSEKILGNYASPISHLAVSSDGNNLVLVLNCTEAHLWHIPTKHLVHRFKRSICFNVAFSGDGRYILMHNKGSKINVWTVNRQENLREIFFPRGISRFRVFPHNNYMCVADMTGALDVHDFIYDKPIATYQAPIALRSNYSYSLEISPKGKFIAASWRMKDHQVHLTIWDALTGKICLQFIPWRNLSDIKMLFVSDDKLLVLIDQEYNRRLDVLQLDG